MTALIGDLGSKRDVIVYLFLVTTRLLVNQPYSFIKHHFNYSKFCSKSKVL